MKKGKRDGKTCVRQASNATLTGALFLPGGNGAAPAAAFPPPALPASALPFSSTPRASCLSSSQALQTAPELSPPQRSHSPGEEEERPAAEEEE